MDEHRARMDQAYTALGEKLHASDHDVVLSHEEASALHSSLLIARGQINEAQAENKKSFRSLLFGLFFAGSLATHFGLPSHINIWARLLALYLGGATGLLLGGFITFVIGYVFFSMARVPRWLYLIIYLSVPLLIWFVTNIGGSNY